MKKNNLKMYDVDCRVRLWALETLKVLEFHYSFLGPLNFCYFSNSA